MTGLGGTSRTRLTSASTCSVPAPSSTAPRYSACSLETSRAAPRSRGSRRRSPATAASRPTGGSATEAEPRTEP